MLTLLQISTIIVTMVLATAATGTGLIAMQFVHNHHAEPHLRSRLSALMCMSTTVSFLLMLHSVALLVNLEFPYTDTAASPMFLAHLVETTFLIKLHLYLLQRWKKGAKRKENSNPFVASSVKG